MNTFNYKQTNIYKFINTSANSSSNKLLNIPLKVLMDDLFVGTRKSKLEIGEKGNSPLMFSKKELPTSQNTDLFRLIFSKDVLGKSRTGKIWANSSLRAFLGGCKTAGSFGPGESIISFFLKNSDNCINKIIKNINNNFFFNTNESLMENYFKNLLSEEKFIISKSDDESKKMYTTFLANKEFDQLLVRIFLSMIFSAENYTKENRFELSNEKAKLIWAVSNVGDLSHVDLNTYSNDVWFCNARKWFETGKYEDSFSLLKRLIFEENFDDTQIKQNIRYLFACHLFDGKGCDQDIDYAISEFKKCNRHKEAQYFLACYYFGMYVSDSTDMPTGTRYLMRAAELGHTQAQIDEIQYILNQDKNVFPILVQIMLELNTRRWEIAEELLHKIKKESCTKSQLSTFYYLNGLIYEHKRSEKADECFRKAYDLGNSDALNKIQFKKMDKHINIKKELPNSGRTIILTNSVTDVFTSNFLRTYNNANVYTTDIQNNNHNINFIDTIRDFINEVGISRYTNLSVPVIDNYAVFFFSNDEEKNLYDTLELLEELYNTVMEMDISSRNKVIDSFDIFLKCTYEHASMFIDATLNKMLENTYFKVHICDPDRDTAHRLLYDIPLFMPFIKQTNVSRECDMPKANCNVVIFSNSIFSQTLAKEIVALGYMGEKYPVTLSVIGDNATTSEEHFFCNLPGLYKCQQQLLTSSITNNKAICKPKCIIPMFYESTLARLNLSNVISNKKNSLNKIVTSGNYFVVDVGNDFQNIQFAIKLRRELLKSTDTFDNTPLIAIRCRDSKVAYAVDNAVLDNKPQGNEFWNKYDFKFFGTLDTLYSYENLVLNNMLEDLACEIHCCYDEEIFRKNALEVLKSYYSSQYNQDSSKITAIGLRYRLFVADLYNSPHEYEPLVFSLENDQEISKQYKVWLESYDENNEYLAGSIEQTRWNGFMLSRGWEAASLSQVVGYKNQPSNGQHKHMIAKLHPFICEWEDLDEMNDNSFIVSLRNKFMLDPHTFNYKIENPKETTIKSVRDTPIMLSLKHIKRIKREQRNEKEY